MEDKKSIDEKLSEVFNVETSNEIIEQEPLVLTPVEKQDVATTDFEAVRLNLYSIIEKGNKAINGILHVASEGDSPRAYEVVSQLIKSVADANKDLLQLHKQLKGNKNKNLLLLLNLHQNITNQSIFVGSTTELQKLLKGKMQEIKQLETDDR
jgi:hypothetical protein